MATSDSTRKLPSGIYQRTDSTGKTRYQVKIRLKGFPPASETFDRLTDAKRWKAQTETAIRERRYFKQVEAERHTVADVIDRYTRDVLPTKGRQRETQGPQLAWWRKELGAYSLAELTPDLIGQARDKLAKTPTHRGPAMSPSTVVRYMAALSHALSKAAGEWGWIEVNPVRKVAKPKEPRGRVRILTDEEQKRLLDACQASASPDLYPAVVLAISTGMRAGELLGLTWDRVDLKRGRLTLEETKNGERRVVPLAGLALELLKARSKVKRIDTRLVWPTAGENPKPVDLRYVWTTAVKKAGLSDLRWHDLRHVAASHLLMNGASLGELAEILGHKTLQMVKRYSHLSEAHAAAVVERMNRAVFGGWE